MKFVIVLICFWAIAFGIVSNLEADPVVEPKVVIVKEYVPYQETVYWNKVTPSAVDAKELGEFEITYYTAGKESTGKSVGDKDYGITASGATVWKGVTVAVDPTVIPSGSYLYIEGIGFRVALDTGSDIKGMDIDVYVPNVKEARKLGRHKAIVYLLSEGTK